MNPLNNSPVVFEISSSSGKNRKISIEEFHVEVLSKHLPDFRRWLQDQYLLAEQNSSGLSTRAIGNKVREQIRKEVEKSPHYRAEMDKLTSLL